MAPGYAMLCPGVASKLRSIRRSRWRGYHAHERGEIKSTPTRSTWEGRCCCVPVVVKDKERMAGIHGCLQRDETERTRTNNGEGLVDPAGSSAGRVGRAKDRCCSIPFRRGCAPCPGRTRITELRRGRKMHGERGWSTLRERRGSWRWKKEAKQVEQNDRNTLVPRESDEDERRKTKRWEETEKKGER